MKRFTLRRELLLLVSTAMLWTACQKEVSPEASIQNEIESADLRLSGVLEEDESRWNIIPVISSQNTMLKPATTGKPGAGGKVKDSDGDGIPDTSDACPTQMETFNGYQDTDGCPDTAPVTTSPDTDADGIPDDKDACPTQKETVNGYEDGDGCPDTVPPPTATDTDGDGITDDQDGCITQKETVNGYLDNDGCPDTVPVVTEPTTLPSSYSLVMPPVSNQGGEGSCVAFSVTYARSYEQFKQSGAASYSQSTNIMSPEFVFNQIKADANCSASSLLSAYDFLVSKGVCTWQSMPYTSSNGCSLMPTTEQLSEALNYKIKAYSQVLDTDITAIKQMIYAKRPLVGQFSIDDGFRTAGPGYIWKTLGSNTGLHTLVICGYDDTKKAFKVLNSWGTGWGDSGYGWVDYTFLASVSSKLLVMEF